MCPLFTMYTVESSSCKEGLKRLLQYKQEQYTEGKGLSKPHMTDRMGEGRRGKGERGRGGGEVEGEGGGTSY